jgi:hypothetical protein
MLNASSLLTALQSFLHRRGVEVEQLQTDPAMRVMIDWFRGGPVDVLDTSTKADVLVYRYGGWSEGCATGFKVSLLRRITQTGADGKDTDWYAGVTLLFEPARYASMGSFSTTSADWPSLEAFLRAIESSPAFKASRDTAPMGVMVESGGMR